MQFRPLSILTVGAILVVVLVIACLVANRPQLITNDAPVPENFPASGFAHASFEELLRK
jgi:hypothetical protein